jgi:2-oxo-4-hydroxy-4-carboxy-5-ureidoimidazoline decarboxylase
VRLEEANALGEREFIARLGAIFERSPWIAEQAWKKKPFRSVDELHQAMMRVVRHASRAQQLALVRAHPELAGAEASEGALTADSSSEQGRLGFTALSREEFLKMADLNRRYREKFEFPCIVALYRHASRKSVIQLMEERLGHGAATELANALEQVGHIARGRLAKVFGS